MLILVDLQPSACNHITAGNLSYSKPAVNVSLLVDNVAYRRLRPDWHTQLCAFIRADINFLEQM